MISTILQFASGGCLIYIAYQLYNGYKHTKKLGG